MTNQMPSKIAIDGPAASGKTTIAKKIAMRLGYLFFDTGVMYRAVTWFVIENHIDIENINAISKSIEKIDIDVRNSSVSDGRSCDVFVNGTDVTWAIRAQNVDMYVSRIAAIADVRKALSKQQRRIGLRGSIVMAGRDIGTVVLPEAELKIYLDACVDVRAKRRYLELLEQGKGISYEVILNGLKERDREDSTRSVAPLKPAADAVIINTDHMDQEQVVESIMSLM